MKRLIAVMVICGAWVAWAGDDQAVVTRSYSVSAAQIEYLENVLRSVDAEKYLAQRKQVSGDSMAEGLRYFLNEFGIHLSDTAVIRWSRMRRAFTISAPDSEHARVGRCLADPADWQVEVEAVMVSFPAQEIFAIRRLREDAAAPREELLRLWTEGKGENLTSIKLVAKNLATVSGQAGSVVNYAGEIRAVPTGDTEGRQSIGFASSLVERMLGLQMAITPTLQTDLTTVSLSVQLELASDPEWQSVSRLAVPGEASVHTFDGQLPQFYRESVTATFLGRSGTPLALGGWSHPKTGQIVYLVITPRVISAQGKTLDEHDFRGPAAF
ncbi:MAG: hypothetical protein U1E27_13595 [Kiritimatiellia bacterium]|nr:hypothetical protein [Kiritimatiellia bacterium]